MTTRSLSTWCRAAAESPADWCARALHLGAGGACLDATLPPDWVDAARAELARRREILPVVALEAPCPRPRGDRPPFLAAADREERRAALDAGRATIRLASETGARVVIVRLGRFELRHGWSKTVRDFGLRTLTRDEIERIEGNRIRMSAQAIDAARQGLDPLVDAADSAGVTIAVANCARWFEIPNDAEMAVLLEDFRGAPLRAWHDAAAAHARDALGFGRHQDTLAALGSHTAGAWLTDAAGLRGGLPWGLGEVDRASVLAGLPDDALRIVHCAPGATDAELSTALSVP